jgi:hypothetical protein
MINLRNVLFVNGISSGVTDLLLVIFAGSIAGLFGVTAVAPFTEVGIFLMAFAALDIYAATRTPMHTQQVQLITILDITWVVVSAVILIFRPFQVSLLGNLLIGGVAVWVALMAYLQYSRLQETTQRQS